MKLQEIPEAFFYGVPQGSGYSLQVLALPSSGCGLSVTIPHAKRQAEIFISKKYDISKFLF